MIFFFRTEPKSYTLQEFQTTYRQNKPFKSLLTYKIGTTTSWKRLMDAVKSQAGNRIDKVAGACLLYTSDAADES